MNVSAHFAKGQRYTIGARIENKFLDLLEISYTTYFSPKESKSQKLAECVLTLDTLKFLIHVAWQAKLLSHKQYGDILGKLDEIGKMFGGWKKSLDNLEKSPRRITKV